MSTITQITLPTWVVGSLQLRCVYLVNNTSFRLDECPTKGPAIPLYLGADLFSTTNIRSENHPRYHAKFAKKGLATKLQFSSAYRLLKLPASNNSLWFYSIQGIFRIAFELFSREDQLTVLENFQDVWKSHINDGPLQMGYSLNEGLDIPVVAPPPRAISKSRKPRTEPGDDSKDHDYCCATPPCPSEADVVSPMQQQMHYLSNSLPQVQPEHLKTIGTLLDLVDSYVKDDLTENKVTEVVMALLQARQWDELYSSPLLSRIGCWLGQQFHQANSSISQRVEGFKMHHIDRISDLPPAEELTQELFPEAMTRLLLQWMGLSEDTSTDKRHSEYPILLLILEFANHNLITGVAHVLYSSLICK
ncbi:unnamed protein product [Knipowitschia caucasica]|uniref:Uncharacterized protein n=1 Tax=Knipowitschia caucasica TaxID=637954 RepID=A0AAV2MTH6_KNICA